MLQYLFLTSWQLLCVEVLSAFTVRSFWETVRALGTSNAPGSLVGSVKWATSPLSLMQHLLEGTNALPLAAASPQTSSHSLLHGLKERCLSGQEKCYSRFECIIVLWLKMSSTFREDTSPSWIFFLSNFLSYWKNCTRLVWYKLHHEDDLGRSSVKIKMTYEYIS